MPLWARVWALRVVIIAALVALCVLDQSPTPALASAVAWSPNGVFLAAFMKGYLRLPRFLDRVHPIEPVAYHWLGVGLVKRIVATRMWPLVIGLDDVPAFPARRNDFLQQVELMTKGAEICHASTFVLASVVALVCVASGRHAAALWICAFNLLLNGYPVMLQRANRWRIQKLRRSPALTIHGALS